MNRAARAALRWGAALLVGAAAATGTAYGVTHTERGDLPGLATEDDGRNSYPAFTRPALPSGAPQPFAAGNTIRRHHAELRGYLLPAPKGARNDPSLPGASAPAKVDDLLEQYTASTRDVLRIQLADAAPTHLAARGWTTPDGVRTRIVLVQFRTWGLAKDFQSVKLDPDTGGASLVDSGDRPAPQPWSSGDGVPIDNVDKAAYSLPGPHGTHVQFAYLTAGDTVALITQTSKAAATVPFRQTVILQAQLLG